MEIIIGDIKLTASEAGVGLHPGTYIYIEVLGKFTEAVQPQPKVLASELKAAIDALEKTCHGLI